MIPIDTIKGGFCKWGWSLVCLALLFMVGASRAQAASFTLKQFTVTPSNTQAGGHPDIKTFLYMSNRITAGTPAPSCDCQDAQTIHIHFPAGVVGSQHATPQCTAADFGNLECPSDSQVGSAEVGIGSLDPQTSNGFEGNLAVYNLLPHPGQAGLLGLTVPLVNFPIYISIGARTGDDFGLDATVNNVTHVIPLSFTDLELWGVPAAESHTPLRHPPGCVGEYEHCFPPGVPSNSPEIPFLSNATTCGVPLSASVQIVTYAKETAETETPYPATTGCDQLSFNPSLFAQPTTDRTDSPSGLEVDLKVPQDESPTVPSPSEIRATTVTLPPGFSINPNAADGKTFCSDADARFGTEEEALCPDESKIGTVSIGNSTLPGALPGYVYIGRPLPGNRYRIFLTGDGFNTHVKLAGSIEPDPQSGQIVTSFKNLPQTPFSDLNIHFFGSERGLLATPTHCGTYAVASTFTPWDSLLPEQTSSQFFTLDSGPGGAPCPASQRPFSPTMRAGVSDNTAAAHSSFAIHIHRQDGDQDLSGLSLAAPPGFAATLAGVPYCADGALAAAADPGYSGIDQETAPSCPAASQIGTATVGAGAGSHPVYLGGRVYLAGPYKGAPLSVAVITPAVSGPYDLGSVLVRAAVHVNPLTAQVSAVSDPLPRILDGIPLRLRSILIDLNRPGFVLNPTNCNPFSVDAALSGAENARAALSSHFQVAGCGELPFGPKLSLRLTGAPGRTGNPALHALLSTQPGESNIARAVVTLPSTELIDNAHIQNPCTRVQFVAGQCPQSTVVGFAEAQTPLLQEPLEGPVYLRSAPESKNGLPDLVAALHGQFDIELIGHIDTVKHHRLRTTFQAVPDAPVSRFVLSLKGGAKGLLENTTNLCAAANATTIVRMIGQNGRGRTEATKLGTSCDSHRRGLHPTGLRSASEAGR